MRHLRPSIQTALMLISFFEFMFLAMIDKFEIEFLSRYITIAGTLALNIYVLVKYGRLFK